MRRIRLKTKDARKPAPSSSAKSGSGRDSQGRFINGNKHSQGYPFREAVQKLRVALFAAVTQEDLYETVRAIIRKARKGNVQAAKLVLDRGLGRLATAAEHESQVETDEGFDVDERFL